MVAEKFGKEADGNDAQHASYSVYFKKKYCTRTALKRAGSKVVAGTVEETTKEGLGRTDLVPAICLASCYLLSNIFLATLK